MCPVCLESVPINDLRATPVYAVTDERDVKINDRNALLSTEVTKHFFIHYVR